MATLLILQLFSTVEACGLGGNIVYAAFDKDIILKKKSMLNFRQIFPCKRRQSIYQVNSGILGFEAVSLGQWLQTLQKNAVTLYLRSPSPKDLSNKKASCVAERSGTTKPKNNISENLNY
jgi:hypothetical protein